MTDLDGPLYFHHLQPEPEGAYLASIPPELRDEFARRSNAFVMDLPERDSGRIFVVAFLARGPKPGDRYGIMVRQDDLRGTIGENMDSIRRTAPEGWEILTRCTSM